MKNTEHNHGQQVNTVGKCLQCNKEIKTWRKFCSHFCYSQHKIGVSHSWGNKISIALSGKPKSKEHIEKVIQANLGQIRPSIRDENHYAWKGDKVSYGTLHDWVSSRLLQPKKCSCCKTTDPKKRYQWSNISGKYQRKLGDWERLCVSCHRKKDKNNPRASLIFIKKDRHLYGIK
jgi:hypothetical protein